MINSLFVSIKKAAKYFLFSTFQKLQLWPLIYRLFYKPKILMYHRINFDRLSDISPHDLELHLEFLCKNFSVIPLEDFVRLKRDGKLQANALSISFDDGYRDFYSYALQVLNKFNVHSTLFVSTDFVENGLWMWPDQVKYILDNSFSESLIVKNQKVCLRNKELAWHTVCDILIELPSPEIESLIHDILKQLSIEMPSLIPEDYQSVTWGQLKEIQKLGHAIESHTVTHSRLSLLSNSDIDNELSVSKNKIDEVLSKKTSFICFPFGRPEDVSEYAINSAGKHGYTAGFYSCNIKSDRGDSFMLGRMGAQAKLSDLAFSLLRGNNDGS